MNARAPHDPPPGTPFGRYRLLERLGKGGMAEVFKAKSFGVEGFEKIVVIKRILPELAENPLFVDMFIYEAKLAVRLSHANIVQVFDLGIAKAEGGPGSYFMAMELVHGFDLATLLSRCRRLQRPLPLEMCVYIASEVAKGLDHAHRRRDEQNLPLGIVHRDVSPQNVLLSFEGEVKVTDFGIAKARGALEPTTVEDTRARKLHGKFAYMSPEQAIGEDVDARSDLFSLGSMLYECITGVNPFSGPTTFETLRRVQMCEHPPVELLRTDIPSDLAALVKQAMAKDVGARFQDAGRMYEALLAFLYQQGKRFGPHDLAEFLSGYREPRGKADSVIEPTLDTELPAAALTPARAAPSVPPRVEPDSGLLAAAADLGELREVTSLALQFGPRDVNDPAVRDEAALTLERYGGTVLHNDSSELVAIFGLSEPDARDTEIATRCGLVLLRAHGAARPSAGVTTGRVHVSPSGEPSHDHRLDGLVAAARELARSGEGLLAMSPAAYRYVRDLFSFETLNDVSARGAQSTTLVVRDVRKLAEAFGRFVGRRDELRQIGEVLALCTRRKLRLVTIRGDNGIGTTRLLAEMERRLKKGGYDFAMHVATCPPRGAAFPRSGIQCMLQVLCGLREGATEAQLAEVKPRLRALGMQEDEVDAVLSVLGASSHKAKSGSADAALVAGFARMVASLSDDQPQVLAWDGAQALDADSFELLEAVVGRLPTARAVLVLAGRSSFSHPLERFASHTSIDLKDLSAEDVEQLIALRLDVTQVPPPLLAFVRERAGGHPLFVEEVLKGLVDARALTVTDRSVSSMRLVGQDLALPKTLRGLVSNRVSRLGSAERALLQAAAVVGDEVELPVLAAMTGAAIPALAKLTATLKVEAFVADSGPAALRFTSPIVREIVVDALTPKAGVALHAAAATALEQVFARDLGAYAVRIATHLYEAGERERVASYFAMSGKRRLAARQLEAAARDYARAIELCDAATREPSQLTEWLTDLADAVRLVRAAPEAFEMTERVVARVDAAGTQGERVRARIASGRILTALHAFDAARAQLAEAERVAGGDEGMTKSVLTTSAELAARQGDFKRSHALLERLETMTSADSADRRRADEHRILLFLAGSHAALGNQQDARRYLARAELLLPGDASAECERLKAAALVAYFARDFRGSAAASERAVDAARELGLGYEVALNLHNLGDALVRLEDYPRAYGAFKQSLALCDEATFDRLASHNRMFLAFLDAVNDDSAGLVQLHLGISYAEARDFTWDVLTGRWLLAKLLLRKDDLKSARAEYERLRRMAKGVGNHLIEGDCDEALSLIPRA
ncbi:MAG TPA: protein kinase [Polyangiaceae bacterium]|nr:protein kinase [Polyangiaceae bacterium]